MSSARLEITVRGETPVAYRFLINGHEMDAGTDASPEFGFRLSAIKRFAKQCSAKIEKHVTFAGPDGRNADLAAFYDTPGRNSGD